MSESIQMNQQTEAENRTALRNRAGDTLLHFTPVATQKNTPLITRGEGCFIFDDQGRRYFDGLASLFCVQIGYSHGQEIAEAASAQLVELPYCNSWGYRHSASERLSDKVGQLAPEGFGNVFFVSGGSDANEAAWKLAIQHFALKGQRRFKAITRQNAYHGTTLGALSLTAIPALKSVFEPLVPGGSLNTACTARLRRPPEETEQQFVKFLLDDLERTIQCAGPESVAILFMEPVQTCGGALVPPAGYFEGVRKICDKHGILICADEVISAFGRYGEWFASPKYGMKPDIISCAKGLSSAYATIGATLVSDWVLEPFNDKNAPFAHGITFGGHPVQAAVALKNLEIMERIDVLGNVRRTSAEAGRILGRLNDLPNVGDVRGDGYLWAVELVSDKKTLETLTSAERDLAASKLAPLCVEKGLIVRVDTRAEPNILISPPLIADTSDFKFIEHVLRQAITETFGQM